MVIDIANFNFDGNSGGGGKPALLQEKTATVVQNGSQTITPDEGFDGMSSVQINAAITGDSSAIDFSTIGYSDEFSAELNAKWNNDVAYSKTLYDAWNQNNPNSANHLYMDDTKLVYAPNIDTSNVTNMEYMFKGCSSLKTVPELNTSQVNKMNSMFAYCSGLTSVPEFDTSKVSDMNNMFSRCYSLTTVPAFDTSNVTFIVGMFDGCSGLTSVKELDTSNVDRMNNMFKGCSSLTTVPAFNTSNVTNMQNMFSDCTSLTSVPEFDTSKVSDMNNMFKGCSSLKTVPAFDTRNVTNMRSMFQYCSSLTSIPEFDTSKANNMDSIFDSCSSLKIIEGISFKSITESKIDSFYLCGFSFNYSIRKAVFKDIGYQSNTNEFNTSYIKNWGVNTDEIPDARLSLIDSLITYSFDRAAAGYPTCTIKLSSNTKALLTEDEIAQINAKGFTIA